MFRMIFSSLLVVSTISYADPDTSNANVTKTKYLLETTYELSTAAQKELKALDTEKENLEKSRRAVDKKIEDLREEKNCKNFGGDDDACDRHIAEIKSQIDDQKKHAVTLDGKITDAQKKYNDRSRELNTQLNDYKAKDQADIEYRKKISNLRDENKDKFNELGLSSKSLLLDIQDNKTNLTKFESEIDKTRMQMYVQRKLDRLINSSLFCDATRDCNNGKKAPTVKSQDLRKVLTDIDEPSSSAVRSPKIQTDQVTH